MAVSGGCGVGAVTVADAFEHSSDSNRTFILLPAVCRWLKSSGRGAGLGRCVGVSVAAARPRRSAWPHCRAAPIAAFDTSISCSLQVECYGGAGSCRGGPCSSALAGDAVALFSFGQGLRKT